MQHGSEEKDDTLSAISGGSLKPELSGQPMTSNITAAVSTTPTIAGNIVPTATPEVDEEEFIAKPPDHAWNKNGSPQKSNCCQLLSSSTYLPPLPIYF